MILSKILLLGPFLHMHLLQVRPLGVKIRNLEVNFKTDFFIQLSHLVTKHWPINKNREDRSFLFISGRFVTKLIVRLDNINSTAQQIMLFSKFHCDCVCIEQTP